MASSGYVDSPFNLDLSLNQNEQDLLVAALDSNKPQRTNKQTQRPARLSNQSASRNPNAEQRSQSTGNAMYTSPQQDAPGSASLTNMGFDESPFLDYGLDDGNIDWDINDDLIGPLPGASAEEEESGDKRKSPGDADEDDDGGGKRRESDDRIGKKPGRKPLTSEPTSKRKAQNRAAQRAFRERKEKHLKDLETKVEDLEKASESTNHENGLLRAQVENLQSEVKEYRKRLSLDNNSYNRSPTGSQIGPPYSSKPNWDVNNNFQFEFPRFGSTSTSGNAQNSRKVSYGGAALIRNNPVRSNTSNTTPSKSPKEMNRDMNLGNGLSTFDNNAGMSDYGDLFSPSVLAAVSPSHSNDYLSFAQTNQPLQQGQHQITAQPINTNQHQSTRRLNSESSVASPESSTSNYGITSSYVTTPESSAASPGHHKSNETGGLERRTSKIGTHEEFNKEIQTVCGTKDNPIPPALSSGTAPATASSQPKTPVLDFQGFDWLAAQNGGTFDPILFGDYRDPQDNIMSGDLNGFFNEALPAGDFSSQLNPSLDAAPPKKKDLIRDIEERQAGKEPETVPGEMPQQFLTCNLLWDRVQRSEKLQSGEADMDDLCTQLKSKAKCSGSGAVIDQKDVDAILGPASDRHDFLKMFK